jgi:hypothetical protein
VPKVGDAVRRCVGEGGDSESGIFLIQLFLKATVIGYTFNFNHLNTISVCGYFPTTIALALRYSAGARNIVGFSTSQGSQ